MPRVVRLFDRSAAIRSKNLSAAEARRAAAASMALSCGKSATSDGWGERSGGYALQLTDEIVSAAGHLVEVG